MLSADFRSFLLAQSDLVAVVGQHVHVNHVPQEIEAPYVWASRATTSHERTLDQAQGEQPFEEQWDVEAISDDLGEAQQLGELLRGLDCAKGAFGAGTIQLMLLEDQSDDYVPRGIPSDTGWAVCAFRVTIFGYVAGEMSSSSGSSSSGSSPSP